MSSLAFSLPIGVGGDAVLLTRSFADLSLSVQQLGQWENSGDVTPEVLLQAINYALVEGYDLMVQKWADYYTIDTTFPIESGEPRYTISVVAPGFYKLRHLAYTRDTTVTSSSRFVRMLPHDIEGATAFSGSSSSSRAPSYRQQGRDLILVPTPTSGTVKVYYIPIVPQFTDVADDTRLTFEVPTEERLIVHLAMRDLLVRSDLSTQSVDVQIQRLIALLRTAADGRDAGQPFYLDPGGPMPGREDEDWY